MFSACIIAALQTLRTRLIPLTLRSGILHSANFDIGASGSRTKENRAPQSKKLGAKKVLFEKIHETIRRVHFP